MEHGEVDDLYPTIGVVPCTKQPGTLNVILLANSNGKRDSDLYLHYFKLDNSIRQQYHCEGEPFQTVSRWPPCSCAPSADA